MNAPPFASHRRRPSEHPAIHPLPPWQPWVALGGFAFHFPWEMFQTPFYAGLPGAAHWAAVLRCTQATGGDVVITWIATAVAAMLDGRVWLLRIRLRAVLLYLTAGLVVSIALEAVNVYVRGEWTYAVSMPTIMGIGLLPLLQWIALPPLTVWLARRHLGIRSGAG